MSINPFESSNRSPIISEIQSTLKSYAERNHLTFVEEFLKKPEISNNQSSWFDRIFKTPSKEETLKGQLFAITQQGLENIPGMNQESSRF